MILAGLLLAVSAPAAAGRWRALAEAAGATERELGIRAERFPTALTLPAVERQLDDPAEGFDEALSWGERLSSAPALSGPLSLGAELLGSPDSAAAAPPAPAASTAAFSCPGLPRSLVAPVRELREALRPAERAAAAAASRYTAAERARLLETFGGLARHEPLAAVEQDDVRLAARFDAAAVAAAAAALAQRVEALLPALATAAQGAPSGRWRCGDALVGGAGDDAYTAADLAGAALVVDLGGRNRYDGPLAAAGPGEARLAVDLGSELAFSSTQPAFGSGVFGVALLYAPTPGRKSFETADLALGAGFFGAGGALAAGPRVSARSGAFAQGAGAFGAGAFVVSGASAALTAEFAAQGFGLTRGAGLFVSRGAALVADCGLRHPDPRDPLAMLSMCQGAGDGPRAYAGGGLGLALVDGDGAALRASYFAQGAGYWHAFGGLYARGDGSSAQARRYVQGAGVHAGAGLLSWRGSGGKISAWGVGPAFGWDYGVGLLSLTGDRNALRTDWAAGDGDVNGRSLAEIEGDGNLLRLADWGLATFKRAAAGYALSRVAGRGNRLWAPGAKPMPAGAFDANIAPWAVTRGEGELSLAAEVEVATVSWPSQPAATDAAQEARASAAALARADAAPPKERVARWLTLAAASSLDGAAASGAAGRLLSLPREEAALVASAASVEAFDEALWVRLVAAAAGDAAARAAQEELKTAVGLRRALLVDLLRPGGARAAVPAALELLGDSDWRLRRAGAVQLGLALGGEGGEEPGRLRFLEQALELSRSSFTAESPEERAAFLRVGVKRLFDLYAVLALDPALSARDRLALIAAGGSPFDPVQAGTLRVFAQTLRRGAQAYSRALDRELASARGLLPAARAALRKALWERDADARAAAFAALGQVGEAEDAARLGAGLRDAAAVVRDAAAAGLGRLGAAGRPEILTRLADASPAVRRLAVLAAAQSADGGVADLLRRGFSDPDAGVRTAAAAALSAVQGPMAAAARKAAAPELARLAAGDPSPSVRATAARQLGRLGAD